MERGQYTDTIEYLETQENRYGTLVIDDKKPSLYMYKGVALYSLNAYEEAVVEFKKAIELYPDEVRSRINLGESQLLSLNFKEFKKILQIHLPRGRSEFQK